MPRETSTRIDARQVIDTSQSSNVPLQVAARTDSVGRNSAGWAIASALTSYAAGMGGVAARQQEAKDKAEHDAGKAASAEQGATGVAPAVEGHDSSWVAGYRESEGERLATEFNQQVAVKMARLEPGTDPNKFYQDELNKYLDESQLHDQSRATFMAEALKGKQPLTEKFYLSSDAEAMKREEENFKATVTGRVSQDGFLTPAFVDEFRQKAAERGMHDNVIDHLLIEGVLPVISSGKGDITKTVETLQKSLGDHGAVLNDLFREKIDLAAKQGQAAKDAEAKKADDDAVAQDMFNAGQLANKGLLGFQQAEAIRRKHPLHLTPEWSAGIAARSAAEAERLAKERAKEQRERQAGLEWDNYDTLRTTAKDFTAKELNDAGNARFGAAVNNFLTTGDKTQLSAVLAHAARTGAPLPDIKTVFGNIDENNTAQATKLVNLYEIAQHTSPAWAARQVDDKTLAKITMFQKQKMLFGADDQQAWSAVKMGTNVDPAIVNQRLADFAKKADKVIPKDFGDHAWNPFTKNTPIANRSELETAYRLTAKNLIEQGFDTDAALDAAKKRVDASFIRVGDRMVRNYGTGDGMDQLTSEAMTNASASIKDKLVANNTVGKDDPVWFVPVPGQEGVWRLKYFAAGGVPLDITQPVTRKGADGKDHTTNEFIDVNVADMRAAHSAWSAQEKKKEVTNTQTLSKLGLPADPLTPEQAQKLAKQHEGAATRPDDTSGYGLSMKAKTGMGSQDRAKAVLKYVNDPSNQMQTFGEFINNLH